MLLYLYRVESWRQVKNITGSLNTYKLIERLRSRVWGWVLLIHVYITTYNCSCSATKEFYTCWFVKWTIYFNWPSQLPSSFFILIHVYENIISNYKKRRRRKTALMNILCGKGASIIQFYHWYYCKYVPIMSVVCWQIHSWQCYTTNSSGKSRTCM